MDPPNAWGAVCGLPERAAATVNGALLRASVVAVSSDERAVGLDQVKSPIRMEVPCKERWIPVYIGR